MAANIGADELQASPGITLFGISLSAKTLGIILAVVGVALAAYGTATQTLPLYESIEQQKSQLAQKRSSVEAKEKEVASKGNVSQRVAEAQQRNKEVLALLPNSDSMDVLLRDLNAQIPQSVSLSSPVGSLQVKGLFEEFRPEGEPKAAADAQFTTRQYSVRFSATYTEIVETLKKIERLKPLLVIQELKVVPNANVKPLIGGKELTADQQKIVQARATPLLAASFKLIAYVPLPEAELKAREAQQKAAQPAQKK
jgi:type IV pilus assembly protein PilO